LCHDQQTPEGLFEESKEIFFNIDIPEMYFQASVRLRQVSARSSMNKPYLLSLFPSGLSDFTNVYYVSRGNVPGAL